MKYKNHISEIQIDTNKHVVLLTSIFLQIRQAVRAEPGNCLVVCDFSQLELRVFAHETKCKAMIDNFQRGGDFHSETALEMYPEIQSMVESGEIERGDIKKLFPDKRKAAKTMNFGRRVGGVLVEGYYGRRQASEIKMIQYHTITHYYCCPSSFSFIFFLQNYNSNTLFFKVSLTVGPLFPLVRNST